VEKNDLFEAAGSGCVRKAKCKVVNRTRMCVYSTRLNVRGGHLRVQKGVFKMWMEYACRNLQFSSSAPNDSPWHERLATPERKKCKLRHARLIACGVNPTFHSQNFTSDHSLAQIGWFEVFWGPCNKQTSLQKYWSHLDQWLVRSSFSAIYL